jgi:anti-anti-sigma regulatory factor
MQQSTPTAYKPCSKSSLEMGSKVGRLSGSSEAFTLEKPPGTLDNCIVSLEDRLRLPFTSELPHMVGTLLRRGERNIVFDLARVSKIDAAGIGELVRAYNMAIAGNGTLRIANTKPWPREMLERVGLFDRLNSSPNDIEERGRTDC